MNEIVVRIEPIIRESGVQTIAAVVTGLARGSFRLWYRIESDQRPDAVAVAHAFAVSAINQAMASGHDLVIDGPLTHGTVMNLDEYQRVWAAWMPAKFKRITVRPRELVADELFRAERGFLLPFSGGLDSLFSAWTLSKSGELGALMPILGLDIPLGDVARWEHTVHGLRACAESLGTPLYPVATNWTQTGQRLPGHLGYFLPIVAAGLLFSPAYAGTVSSAGYSYDDLTLPNELNALTDPLLGRPGYPVRHYGAFAHRIDKVAAIAAWPEALRCLRPCEAPAVDGGACGRCRKCVHTMLSFLGLGLPVPSAFGGQPPRIEDIERFAPSRLSIMALRDAAAAARERGIRAPWVTAAEKRLIRDQVLPTTTRELEELRRRFDYVIGGASRPAPLRFIRRVVRALRGTTGPRELRSRPARPSVATPDLATGNRAAKPMFALSPGGRRIYVANDDLRGAALIEKAGAFDATALAIWRRLVDSCAWTHVLDIGANYGEMIIDLDTADRWRVIAVEPNPHVAHHLERSLREAGLTVEIVQKAASDRAGSLELTIDRTWSGMSSATVHPMETLGHRLETIRAEAITLRALLDDGSADRDKRVLLKLDVEGQELAALRSLEGAATAFGDFAAMVEVRYFSEGDFAILLESFSIELFDMRAGMLITVADATPARLADLLVGGDIHPFDVVLRPRLWNSQQSDAI